MTSTVLIIDDNMQNIQLAANVLKDEYKILYATSGEEGLERLKRNEVHLVLLDVMMPKIDGFKTARVMKSSESFQDIPIIFLTASDDDESLHKGFEHGAVDFILKPFNPLALKLRVKTQLEFYRTKRELQLHLDENVQLLRQYKEMVDKSSIISKSDLEGNITYVNEAFEKISGYSKAELIGRSHNIVRHPDMPQSLFESMWKTIRNKELFRCIIKNRHKSGSAYYVRSYIAPILSVDGDIVEYISIRQDITKEILSLEHEQNINELKDEFLRNLSHEIKTPLNTIMGYSSMLSRKVDDEKIKEYLKEIETGSGTIAALMDNLVHLTQLKSGSYKITIEEAVLKPVLGTVLDNFRETAKEKGIGFEYEIDPAFSESIACDCKVLQWIVEELCENAIKFTPSGGQIVMTILYDELSSSVMVEVQDSGVGISDEEKEQIFDLFHQVEGSRSRTKEGFGIGLSMVKKLTEELLGSVEVESEPGQGALFRVSFPVERALKG